jgi:pimeloyl-ACP methyl ester carboxylesterase
MTLELPDARTWAARCAADGEFRLAARRWNGGLRLTIGATILELGVREGEPEPTTAVTPIGYEGCEAVWGKLLAGLRERFHNDLLANIAVCGGISRSGDPLVHSQYYGAAMRAVELLRAPAPLSTLRPARTAGVFDAATGRYVHLDLDGSVHRIYFEEAGSGIPVLMQHTAGCHGSQWRHLMEEPTITDRFRLIAYDLPFHGKSLPPVGPDWWATRYRLTGAFLRSVPLALTDALALDRPVFMGCSVGGLLALDLAHKHANTFRAVIAVEGALHIGGDIASLEHLWHPQVSNEYKARLMDGLMAPSSPLPYRRETSFVYACGWPPAFLGDLHYYVSEFDLRADAGAIDTSHIGVHILSGEYDYSGTSELGRAAHEAIAGSTWTEMTGVGHFPMSEHPDAFINHLLPILGRIAAAR